ncbi:MAG: phage major capsid protein [Proteobacteria bacterium]|nr:phage major capsid protein [Pseudomonadota bacterium]
MNIQALREMLADKVNQAQSLQMQANFGPLEQKSFDNLMADARSLENRIQAAMRLDGLTDPIYALSTAAQAADIGSVSITNQPRVYKNLGEQLLDVRDMTLDTPAAPRARERHQQIVNAAGASTGIGSEGGYLVETDKAANIYETAIETGVFASRCALQPVGADSDSFSYLAADDRDRSDGKINGIQVYRKAEAETMEAGGKAQLKERELRVEDMYGLVYVTNRMLRDASAMSEYIKRTLREQLAFKLDLEIFEGNGSGQCLGITASDIMVTVAKEASQANDAVVAENIVKMLARFRGNVRRAAWFVNQDVLSQLPLLKVGDQPVYGVDWRSGNPFGTLLGLPVQPVEFCQTLGNLNDIILGDFGQYMLISKGGIEEVQSIHVRFLTDESAFRFLVRNNGQPIHDRPITPLRGGNTLSPFVNLAARGE